MLESKFTSLLLKNLRELPELNGCIIWKHSNFYTAGIPDFSVTRGTVTHWVEVKMYPNYATALQLDTLRRLARGGHGLIYVRHNCIQIDNIANLTFDQAVKFIAKFEGLSVVI